MPFGFFRKSPPGSESKPPAAPPQGYGVPFEGLTEEWRLAGVMHITGRLSDALNRREAIAAFVILRGGFEPREELVDELREHVAQLIGPIAKPKSILFTEELPKTRSGKIMRRLLRSIAKGEQITQDTSTLENPAILEQLAQTN